MHSVARWFAIGLTAMVGWAASPAPAAAQETLSLRISGENPLVGGGSDANTVGGVGLAAIDGLGPRGAGFHTPGEYVELDSFAPKAEALARFLWGRLK